MFPQTYMIDGINYPVVNRDMLVRKENGEFDEFKIGVIFVWKCEGFCNGYHLESDSGVYYKADFILSENSGRFFGIGKTDNHETSDDLSLIESALFDLSVCVYCSNR